MRSAQFCLVPRGDSLTSRRLFDAIMAGCVPIILSDGIPLPFRAELGPLWAAATVQVPLLKFMQSPLATVKRAMANGTERATQLRRALFLLRKELRWGSGSPFRPSPDFGSAPGHVVRAVHRRITRNVECDADVTQPQGAGRGERQATPVGAVRHGANLVVPGAVTVDELEMNTGQGTWDEETDDSSGISVAALALAAEGGGGDEGVEPPEDLTG